MSIVEFVHSAKGQANITGSVQTLADVCHGVASECGWWTDPKTGESLKGKRNVGEMLCLVHSEISEAMEGHRKNLMDDKLPHRPMIEVELADAMIRILDLAGGLDLDLAGALTEKLAFNTQRPDHKPENRLKEGGKAY
jgi:NTP pyrophosphatase (non-canonical NTP hydrolase)